jgi:uncharacterized protein (TIGR02117 family)
VRKMRGLKRAARGAGWLLGGAAAICGAYAIAAWISAMLPLSGARHAESDVARFPIYLCADAIHTDFAIPMTATGTGGLDSVGAALPQGLPADTFVRLGWGDYDFFRKITTLDEFDPGVATGALLGLHRTAVRVMPISARDVETTCTAISLSAAGEAALLTHIADTLAPATPPLLPGRYGELYLPAHGRYSPFNTCNQWTANALGKAGLAHAAFAPFTFGVTWPLAAATKASL